MTKLKNSNCDKTQKLKFWQSSKTETLTELKNSNCDKTQTVIKLKNSKLNTIKQLKLWQNYKKKKWQNFETQIVKEKNSRTQIVKKIEKPNCYKTSKLILS